MRNFNSLLYSSKSDFRCGNNYLQNLLHEGARVNKFYINLPSLFIKANNFDRGYYNKIVIPLLLIGIQIFFVSIRYSPLEKHGRLTSSSVEKNGHWKRPQFLLRLWAAK